MKMHRIALFRKLILIARAFLMMRLLFIALIFLGFGNLAQAKETIRDFSSRIVVSKSGELTVTETISVRAEGRQIKRGIYRDLPLLIEDANGRNIRAGFELLSVTRGGNSEPHHVRESSDGVRIYIGSSDVFLPTGNYTYTIKYKTDRQIRFFESHDEVFWNVTGNEWNFSIANASAKIVLPEGVSSMGNVAYLGKYGSREQSYAISETADGQVVNFSAGRALAKGEGLTVGVKMPAGTIVISAEQKSDWFWQDNLNAIMAAVIGLVVTAYYFVTWLLIGRDPQRGVVVPRWDAPDDLSPALVNYIDRKGIAGKGWDAITSAILNLAVKGLVTLDKTSGDLVITKVAGDQRQVLPVGERAVLNNIGYADGDSLLVSSSYGSKVKVLQEKFYDAMEREHRNKFYHHNLIESILGILVSVLGLVAFFMFGNLSGDLLGPLLPIGIFTAVFSTFLIKIVKSLFSGKGFHKQIGAVIFAGFFAFTFVSGSASIFSELFGIVLREPWPLMLLVGLIVLNILFYFLLGAPTPLGRKKMDQIEGLKTYLTLAEKDRMNMKDAPDFSIKHYETLLPYAVALGVEKPWSRAFETWLAAAIAAGAVAGSYNPHWYGGRPMRPGSVSDTMNDFTNSMQSDFSSAMPVPKSSSSGFSGSGGGGFSGGGGGGGGGGGW